MSTPTTARRLGDEKHKCPKDGCDKMLTWQRLACRPHWFSLSLPTRKRVLFAWAGGRGLPTTEYLQARAVAVAELNGVRHCRKCGCTEDDACTNVPLRLDDGSTITRSCAWAGPDLCDGCT